MSIFYNLQGPARKRLVAAVSEVLNLPASYNGAPTFSYTVGDYTVDRLGTISRHIGFSYRQTKQLITALAARGFKEAPPKEITPEMVALTRPHHALSIDIPLDGFTELALENLSRTIANRSTLIQRALGQVDPSSSPLSFDIMGDRLCFPWFRRTGAEGEVEAYAHFVHALCEMAKRLRRVSVKPEDTSAANDKFVMRLFLVRLGLKGPQYKQTRKILLQNLSGNGSWKEGRPPAEQRGVAHFNKVG